MTSAVCRGKCCLFNLSNKQVLDVDDNGGVSYDEMQTGLANIQVNPEP